MVIWYILVQNIPFTQTLIYLPFRLAIKRATVTSIKSSITANEISVDNKVTLCFVPRFSVKKKINILYNKDTKSTINQLNIFSMYLTTEINVGVIIKKNITLT